MREREREGEGEGEMRGRGRVEREGGRRQSFHLPKSRSVSDRVDTSLKIL